MKKIIIIFLSLIVLIGVLIITGFLNIGFAKFEDEKDIKETKETIKSTMSIFLNQEQNNLLKNEIVFFNSWATWCSPCIKEIPSLIEIKKRTKNVTFISYCSDVNVKEVDLFLTKREIEFPFVLLDSKPGLRITIYKYLKEKGLIKDDFRDSVPLNIILKNDSIVYFSGNIQPNIVDSIVNLINNL